MKLSFSDRQILIAELQTKLSAGAITLTEQLLHFAMLEMDAMLFEQVLDQLRQKLPEFVNEKDKD